MDCNFKLDDDVTKVSLAEPLIVVFMTMQSYSRFNVFFNVDYVVV